MTTFVTKTMIAVGVLALQFQPDIERIERAARKRMADFARAHNDVDASRGAGL